MLVERIIGAFTFRRRVYAEVERDTAFTMAAWLLIAVVAFLNHLGTHASRRLLEWLGSTVVGMIWAVIAFAVAAAPLGPTRTSTPARAVERIRGAPGATQTTAEGYFGFKLRWHVCTPVFTRL